MDSGEENRYDFFINMDNIYLESEIKDSKIDPHVLEARYEHGMVLLGMSILNFGKSDKENNNPSEWPLDTQVSQFTDAAAPFLLPIIANLGGDLESLG